MMDLNPKLNFFYDVLPSDLQTHILQIRKKNRLNEIENAIKDLFKTKRNEIIYFKEDLWKIRRTSVKSYLKIPSVIAIINAEYVWDEYEDPPMLVNYYQEYWGSSDFKEVMRNQGLNFEWYDELWGIIRINDEKINSDLLFEKEKDISPEDSSDDEEEKKFKEELTDKLVDLLFLESLMDCKIENVKKKIEEMRKANALKQFKNQKKEEDNEINKEDEIKTIRWTRFKQKAEKERKEKEYVYEKLKRMFKDNYLDSKEFKYIVENDEIIEFIILKDRMKF
jgi:hypothetical protein